MIKPEELKKIVKNNKNKSYGIILDKNITEIDQLKSYISFFSKHYKSPLLCLTYSNQILQEMSNKYAHTTISSWEKFCLTILENHGNLICIEKMPFVLNNNYDIHVFLLNIIQKLPEIYQKYIKKSPQEKQLYLYDIQTQIRQIKHSMKNITEVFDESYDIHKIYPNYQQELLSANLFDCEDLLIYTQKLFFEYPEIAKFYGRLYPHIFLLNAQEVSKLIYIILLQLYQNNTQTNQTVHWFIHESSKVSNISLEITLIDDFMRDFSAQYINNKSN